ncbi:hypothetical protein [Pseudodesulfovibrio sp.]|uniref:hypothetical protein n=1 Tax=unclassified Pseudodesulfovibrio TaxID=2661612 RepID=UPI003AFFFB6D
MKLNKTQRRLLLELKPTYAGQTARPDLSRVSRFSFTDKELQKYNETGIFPERLRQDVTYLIDKKLIISSGLCPEYSISDKGMDSLSEPHWIVASTKKGVQNAIEKWTVHVLSFFAGMAVLKLLESLR